MSLDNTIMVQTIKKVFMNKSLYTVYALMFSSLCFTGTVSAISESTNTSSFDRHPEIPFRGNNGWISNFDLGLNQSMKTCNPESELRFSFRDEVSDVEIIPLIENDQPSSLIYSFGSPIEGYVESYDVETGEVRARALLGESMCISNGEGYTIFVEGEDYYTFYYNGVFHGDEALYHSTIFLKSREGHLDNPSVDYQHIAPQGTHNVSPSFILNVNKNGIATVPYAIFKYDAITNILSPQVDNEVVLCPDVSECVSGNKTLNPVTLDDGVYVWSYYLHSDSLSSGFSGFDWPFVFDSTAPVSDTPSHSPANPDTNDVIHITTQAIDVLAGITKISIYVDETFHSQATFSEVHTASFDNEIGTYTTGEHTYFFVTEDGAGNTSTSSTETFTVNSPLTSPDLVTTNISPLPNTILNGDGIVTFQGSVQNLSEIGIDEGGYIRLEIDWDSNGGEGTPEYDIAYTIPNADTRMGTFTSNEAKVFSHMVTDIPVGIHRYRFRADVENTVSETNEVNNISDWSTFRTIRGELSVSPQSIDSGETVSVRWNVSGGGESISCIVDDGVGANTWTGTSDQNEPRTSAPLSSNTTFTLSCNDVLLDSQAVTVNAQPELSIVPRIVPAGENATIFWNTHNNNEGACSLKNGPYTIDYIPTTSGDPNTGFADIVIEGRSRFVLECPGGSTTYEVEIVPRAYEI